jgi:hypothetical protein
VLANESGSTRRLGQEACVDRTARFQSIRQFGDRGVGREHLGFGR